MSSEESEVDEETQKVKDYNVRPFVWESRQLSRFKRKLEQSHQDSLPGLTKRVFIHRQQGEPFMTKQIPVSWPDWAYVNETAPMNTQDETSDNLEEDLNLSCWTRQAVTVIIIMDIITFFFLQF